MNHKASDIDHATGGKEGKEEAMRLSRSIHVLLHGSRIGSINSRPLLILGLCLGIPLAAYGNCVVQPNGSTVICDSASPNPFTNSISVTNTPGSLLLPASGAQVTLQAGSKLTTTGAAVQVQNNSAVINGGAITTTFINAYGIWAGDPNNSTSTTAGYGNTLENDGSIVTNGSNSIGLFARTSNKSTGNTLINRGTINTYGSISGTSTRSSSAGIRSESVVASNIFNYGTVAAHGAYATIGTSGVVAVAGNGVEMAGPGTFNNAAGATVTSDNAYGFYASGTNANGITVINAGTISGKLGAIRFSNGLSNNSVVLQAGSVVNGSIDAGTGGSNNLLAFDGYSSSAFNNAILNWQTVALRNGAAVTLSAPSYALVNLSLDTGTAATFSAPQVAITGQIADNGTLIFNSGNGNTITAPIQGSGSLIQTGPGTLILSGAGTYSGATQVMAGTLQAGASGVLSANSAFSVNEGATLDLGGADQSIGSLAGAGGVSLGAGTLTTGGLGSSTLFSGVASGSGGLVKTGGGVFVLTGANVYTGSTRINAGTLQLGNGGTTGSVAGPIVDDAMLAIDRSDTLTLSHAISGVGSLNQAGTGTTVLLADNTYSGGTAITQGTLQLGNGGTTGSVVGPIVDNGALNIARSDTLTLASSLSGTGSLTQAGSGTTVLTADNTYTGGTTIAQGTLQLGNGGTSGSVAGDIIDNSDLVMNRSDDVTLADTISGSGTFNKLGGNTVTLTGNNSFTGVTTVSSGTLQIGNGGSSGSIVGATVNNGVLQFNRSDNLAYAGAISGSGSVRQAGTGSTMLSGANTYTGGTFIDAGVLGVSADANLGDPAGAIHLAGGTLSLGASFNTARSLQLDGLGGSIDTANLNKFSGPIGGSGALTKTGSGAVVFNTPAGSQAGAITVAAGTLAVGDGAHADAQLASTSGITVEAGADFGGYGQVTSDVNNGGTLGVGNALPLFANGPDATFTINGRLTNTGEVTLANGVAGDRLIVNGTYVSAGGRLLLDAVLNEGGGAAQSDHLVANAVTLTGSPTGIVVHNIGGAGAVTAGDGIPLINVGSAAASAGGAFVLAERVVAGPYEYLLYNGGDSDTTDGQWYLRSTVSAVAPAPTPGITASPTTPLPSVSPEQVGKPIYRPEPGAYLANREAASDMLVQTLHDRQGYAQYALGADDPDGAMGKAWLRVVGDSARMEAGDGLIEAKGNHAFVQLGGEVGSWNLFGEQGRLHVGGMLGHGNANADASALFNPTQAHGHVNGDFAGAYATWFADDKTRLGSYLDTWLQYGWFDNQVSSTGMPSVDYHSKVWAASLEYGYAINVGAHLAIEPELQVVYSDYRADSLIDGSGTTVKSLDNGVTLGRLGVRLYPQLGSDAVLRPFVELDWWHGGGANRVAFNGMTVADAVPANRFQINAGFQSPLASGWVIWARIGDAWGSSSYRRAEGLMGLKFTWL